MSQLYLIDRNGSPLASSRILDVQEVTPHPNPLMAVQAKPQLSGRYVVKVPDGIPVSNPQNLGDLLTKKAQGFLLFYAGFTRVTFDDLTDTSNIDFTASKGIICGQRGSIVLEPGGVLQSLTIPLVAGLSGSGTATVTVAGPIVTVTGLTGMSPFFVGNPLTISGSSVPANNGTFPIASFISSTSVTITNPIASTDTGGDSWALGLKPTQAYVTWDTFNYVESDSSAATYARQYNELPSVPAFLLAQVSFDGVTFTPALADAALNIPVPQQGTSFIMQLTNSSTQRLGIGSWTVIY